MRRDMKRVIIDTGRFNSPWDDEYLDEGKELSEEDHPIRARKTRKKSKSFGDRTQPLYRFLQGRVGKNWDDVWSEVCKDNDERSVDGHHLRRHVLQYVDLKVTKDEKTGRLIPSSERRWFSNNLRTFGFFVDPNTNQLRSWEQYNRKAVKKEKQKAKEARLDRNTRTIDGQTYKKINGCWFHCWTEVTYESHWDYRTQTNKKTKVTYDKKRQLNANELRDLKLRNHNSG